MALRREPAGRDLGLTVRMGGSGWRWPSSALLALDGLRPPTTDLRGRAVQALCIVPTRRRGVELLSDHPPVEKRVRRLEELPRLLGKVAA